jgi:hypothetical protein
MTIEVEEGDVVVVGEERLVATVPARLTGTAKPKRTRQGGPPLVVLECPEGCARGDDGRAYHVSMGSSRVAQWGAPFCGFCKTRLVRRDDMGV